MPVPPTGNLGNTANGSAPCEGPRALSYNLDFSVASSYDVDLTQQFQGGQFTTIQGFYCDNSQNASPLIVTCGGTGQTLVVPPFACAYLPMLQTLPPKFNVATAGLIANIFISFFNFYIPPMVWKTT